MEDRQTVHDAFVRGDLTALRATCGDPLVFPNTAPPPGFGEHVLQYAIYHSALAFIRELLECGADPAYRPLDGFPAVIAALASARADRFAVVELLLDHGADVEQRGINDWTPLHYAAAANDVAAIELLCARGADATARTRVDDRATPREEAEILGRAEAVRALRMVERR